MTTTEEFRPRVRKGIAAIEAYESGATDRIDLAILDVYSLQYCPLAQSLGNGAFYRGRNRLDIWPTDDETAKYGFSLTADEAELSLDVGYASLREAWVAELTEHRTAKAALVAD